MHLNVLYWNLVAYIFQHQVNNFDLLVTVYLNETAAPVSHLKRRINFIVSESLILSFGFLCFKKWGV